MTVLTRLFNSKHSYFFKVAALGPLLLLSTRLLYSLSISLILLVHISLMILLRILLEKTVNRRLWFSMELFSAAVCISIIDMLMSAYLPLIRADMGILFPFIFFQGQVFLSSPLFLTREEDREKTNGDDLIHIYGELFGYIAMLLILALFRELLSYGSISLVLRPWEAGTRTHAIVMFSSIVGLLFLFISAYIIREEE